MKMAPPTVTVDERRRRGRPPVSTTDTPPADVHLVLPAEDYDHAYRLATKGRCSVQRVIRHALRRLIEDERG